MTRPFLIAFKKKMVEQLTGKDAISQRALARSTGVSQTTASRWMLEARSLPVMARKKNHRTKTWSVEDKVRVLAAASNLTGAELTALLEKEGLLLAELEQWRLALDEEGRSSLAITKRINSLERKLARKEKALAEAAALLILKKKVDRLLADEDDDTDDESEP